MKDILKILKANKRNRLALYQATAARLGTQPANVEKDLFVCWTLDALYNRVDTGGARLLFKGGTSLSRAFNLISRFSEDVDITVWRHDLGFPVDVADLEAMSAKSRKRTLEQIKEKCGAFISGPVAAELTRLATEDCLAAGLPPDAIRIVKETTDPDAQSLFVEYPTVTEDATGYVRPRVMIESGAKSAVDPHVSGVSFAPYLAEEMGTADLLVTNVTAISPDRTFGDKVVILHGMNRWHENRGEVMRAGNRLSRHYYDISRLVQTGVAARSVADGQTLADCVRHAQMFFNRNPFDLDMAAAGNFDVMPRGPVLDAVRRDYHDMRSMIFGVPPSFDEILADVEGLQLMLTPDLTPAIAL